LEEARIQKANALLAQMPIDPSQKLIVDSPEFHAFKDRVASLPVPPERARETGSNSP
jgi:hypothetical protein